MVFLVSLVFKKVRGRGPRGHPLDGLGGGRLFGAGPFFEEFEIRYVSVDFGIKTTITATTGQAGNFPKSWGLTGVSQLRLQVQ